ncbi:DUF6882 domain-containing protein [Actinomadura rugatobispora]|uniref:DUF6882 domain-containing protein n=1 Tax=Actinomadura rugatobispora TaxID=1994 RepID=A0ABW1AGU7_9ACTN|nr:hypothetical protein GCM10010200_092890 [Actinomadura rugatobispora]
MSERGRPTRGGVHSPEFEAFGCEGSAAAIHRQEILIDALGDGHVQFDMHDGVMTVGGDRTFHGTTLLGSFSHLPRTWLWLWENPHFDLTLPAFSRVREIREFGRRRRIPEFATGHQDFSGFPDPYQAATTMVIAAAALLGGNGVHAYRVNDGQGSAFLHVDDPRLPADAFPRLDAARLIMRAIEVFPADHRRVVRGFAAHYGFRIRESGAVIDGRHADGHGLTAGFTADGLLDHVTVN